MAAWPSDLPQKPLVQGFSETPPNLLTRSPMDIGPAKVRRRSTAGVTVLQCVFRLTTTQRASLLTFWQTTLAGGVTQLYLDASDQRRRRSFVASSSRRLWRRRLAASPGRRR